MRHTLQPVEKQLTNIFIAPDGKRVLVEARGDIFSVPAENGPVKDITQSSGVAERFPAWSPDGKTIAYWSDRSGEYELTIREAGKPESEKKLSAFGAGFRYNLYWSPDSKKLAFIDKAMKIYIYDLTTDQATLVDHGLNMSEGPPVALVVNWSPRQPLAHRRPISNQHRGVFIYDVTGKQLHPVTSGYYSCSSPVFDVTGKYLFVTTNQSFNPLYSDLDNTFIYPNTTSLAAIVLKKSTPSPLYPKDDTVAETTAPVAGATPSKPPTAAAPPKPATPAPPPAVAIEFEGLESRLILLPADIR